VNRDNQTKRTNHRDGQALIVLKNVTKKFGKKVVLDRISLSIEKGKTTVVIGPSGCGEDRPGKTFDSFASTE